MNIISIIIEELTDSQKKLSDTLLRVKVLASRIKNEKLLMWVNNELEGYDANLIPKYREIPGILYGTLTDGYRIIKNHNIATSHLKDDIVYKLSTVYFNSSISELDALLESKEEEFVKPIPPEYFTLLSEPYQEQRYNVIKASSRIIKAKFKGVITAVKSTLLNLMLEIEKD